MDCRFFALFVLCVLISKTSQKKDPEEILIGGVYEIHNPVELNYGKCSDVLNEVYVFLVEAHLFALDYVNSYILNDTSVSLITEIIDSCTSENVGLRKMLKFIPPYSEDQPGLCTEGVRKPNQVFAAVGGIISDDAKVLTNLLQAFCVPFIASVSTSTEFDAEYLYPYFARMISSDVYQAQALAEILVRMNWLHIGVIYESSTYGVHLQRAFKQHLETRSEFEGICVETYLEVLVESEPVWNDVVTELSTESFRVLLVLLNYPLANEFFLSLTQNGLSTRFQLVGVDAWSSQIEEKQLYSTILNSITVEGAAAPIPEFLTYLSNLSISKIMKRRSDQQYMAEWIARQYNCSLVPSNDSKLPNCSGAEQILENSVGGLRRSAFAVESIMVLGEALKTYIDELAGNNSNVPVAQRILGSRLNKIIGQTNLNYSFDMFRFFNGTRSGPPNYYIFQFQYHNDSGQHQWKRIGSYSADTKGVAYLDINSTILNSTNEHLAAIQKEDGDCFDTCHRNQYKTTVIGSSCCNNCTNCPDFQYSVGFEELNEESDCIICPSGFIPNANFTSCILIAPTAPEQSVLNLSIYAVTVLLIFVCVLCVVVYVKHLDSPIVKFTGNHLNIASLLGCVGVLGVSLLMIAEPSVPICGTIWGLLTYSITVVLCTMVSKLRTYLLVSRTGQSHLSCTSELCKAGNGRTCYRPAINTFTLSGIQVLIVIFWGVLRSPGTVNYRKEDQVGYYIACSPIFEPQTILLFVFPQLLLASIFYLGYKALQTPFYFALRQTRFSITGAFCMMAVGVVTIIVLLSVPDSSTDLKLIVLQVTSLSLGTVILFCTVLPDVYLLWFKPHKNTIKMVQSRRVAHILPRTSHIRLDQLESRF